MARRIQKKRDASLDFLRVIAALAVVWLHVSGDVVGTNPDIHQLYWWTGNIVNSLTRWCVPVFVMISGSLLLNKPSDKDPSAFYRSSLPRILIPLAFWTLFYFLLREWAGDQPSIFRIAGDVLRGAPFFHLWFLYMIAGLYLATPFLRQIVVASSPATLGFFISGCFAVSIVESLLGGQGATPGFFVELGRRVI